MDKAVFIMWGATLQGRNNIPPNIPSSFSLLRLSKMYETRQLAILLLLLGVSVPVTSFLPRSDRLVATSIFQETLSKRHTHLEVLRESQETLSAGANQDDFPDLSEINGDEYDIDVTPGAQRLIARLTENYVFGKSDRIATTVDDVLAVVESDFKIRQVPVQIGQSIFDASSTGIALDQSVVEIMSFAAYHGLPERLTAEILSDSSSLGESFATAKRIFAEQGWAAVSFPQGLGIQPRQQKRPWLWTKRKKQRITEAIRAVRVAAAARNPIRQLSSQKEFLAKLVAEEYSKATKVALPTEKNFPFFPQNLPLPSFSWQRLRRMMERSSSKIKQKGKAGVLAYAMFNFCVYSVGMLWQWRRIAAADVTSTSSATVLTLRKFGRVFGTVYIVSNLLKVPKLLAIAGMAPLTEKFLKRIESRTAMSETRILILCLSALVSTWMALMAVPVISEVSRIRRLIFLESLLWDQYTITQPAVALTMA
jgi:hypothetical protein